MELPACSLVVAALLVAAAHRATAAALKDMDQAIVAESAVSASALQRRAGSGGEETRVSTRQLRERRRHALAASDHGFALEVKPCLARVFVYRAQRMSVKLSGQA